MATYPSGNPGAYPLDPGTDVGRFRLVYGDTDSTPYSPVEPGFQNYEELSDDEIEAFLSQGSNSINRAIGYYYISLAGAAAKQSRSIKDYDLSVDVSKRAADLRAIAQWWFDLADNDDATSAEEAFEIVPIGDQGDFIPEGTIPIYGRSYIWDRWR